MTVSRPITLLPIGPKDNRRRIEAVQTTLERCDRDLAEVDDEALSAASKAMVNRALHAISDAVGWLNRALNHGTDSPIDASFVRHDQALPACTQSAPSKPTEGIPT